MPKTVLENQMDAATDAHLGGTKWPTLNGLPLFPPMWASAPFCAQCDEPVESMEIVFCPPCRERADAFYQRGAK